MSDVISGMQFSLTGKLIPRPVAPKSTDVTVEPSSLGTYIAHKLQFNFYFCLRKSKILDVNLEMHLKSQIKRPIIRTRDR